MIKVRHLLLVGLGCVFWSCLQNKPETELASLQKIIDKDTLTAVTVTSSTSYFIYRMQQMGYEYDLIADFADSLGVNLNLKIAENINRLEEMLAAGEADVVAYPVQMDNKMKQKYLFCGIEQQNHLVIVQSANKGDTIVRDVTGLIGKEVWTMRETRHHERLETLNAELGGGIIIRYIERDTVTTEDLIGMVAGGEIRFTVSDDNLARLNRTYYNNINISLAISFPQRASWITGKESRDLAEAVNEWAAKISKSPALRTAAKRYFERSKTDDYLDDSQEIIIRKGDISPYDSLFKQYAEGWDWKLLVSIAWQESKFHSHLESWAGAKGLMGIMPRTARSLGFEPDSLANPAVSIQAGVKCLLYLEQFFTDITDSEERIKFVLASYNAGNGHITDARSLARKYGRNPNVWDNNVAEFIRLKSEPEYYNDPVCKHGYLRGTETYRYINEVIARYKLFE